MIEVLTAVVTIGTVFVGLLKVGKWLWLRFSRPDPEISLKHGAAIKSELEKHFDPPDKYGIRGEAIIRNVLDSSPYPDGDTTRRGVRISNWFKVEIKDFYHNGLEVYVRMGEVLRFDPVSHSWSLVDSERKPDDVVAWRVGRIPFEFIRHVVPYGDEYYPIIHIFCAFKGPLKTPYEDYRYYYEGPYQGFMLPIDEFRPWETEVGRFKRIFLRFRLWLNV